MGETIRKNFLALSAEDGRHPVKANRQFNGWSSLINKENFGMTGDGHCTSCRYGDLR
jgi:hypothetical protein